MSLHRCPLDEFKAKVLPAYGPNWEDSSWDEAIDDLVASSPDLEVIGELRADLRGPGLNDPIVVIDGRVANGMHRVAAHVLEGCVEIAYVTSYPAEEGPIIEVEMAVRELDGTSLSIDRMEEVWGYLRSFRMGDIWVETDTWGSYGGTRCSGAWYCPHERSAQLREALKARALRHRVALEVLGMSLE